MPAVLPITEMQRNGAALTDEAIRTKEPIYLTRHGKSAVVVIDAEEFDRRMRYRDAIIAHEQRVYEGIMQGHRQLSEGQSVSLDRTLADIDAALAR